MKSNTLYLAAAILGAFAVALGAFGAHALKNALTPDQLAIWRTAVDYQFYHIPAILFCGYLVEQGKLFGRIAGLLFIAGILLFSGSLYLMVLLQLPMLGMVTPIGGVMLIIGWLTLGYRLIRSERASPHHLLSRKR
ncbi:DUF423 domain-containing protein [Ectothiorhodospiraceae bacterium BW-2]|nr:DUF423 domain-containing protein [Ectothiorhodospiraceae bacterium BW-2]